MNHDHLLIDALTLSYRSAGHLVRPVVDLDLAVAPGELVLLHGPSGCGKTTLLSAIAGLLTPDSGSIRVGDVEVSGLTGADLLAHRRRRVGMVFQSFNLLPSLTAVENVEVPLRLTGHGRREARARAVELLERFDMGHRLGHRPGMLSGGQQQRVAIARALAVDPPVVIADEPTAHLDHEQVDSVCATFRAIADTGRVVLVATHDDRLDEWADRRVTMSAGTTRPAGIDRSTVDVVGRRRVPATVAG